jgi:hypothetical protein
MSTVRLVSLLLTITLTGPSVASVLCDWTCAAKHQAAAPAESGCHKRDTFAAAPTVAAGHVCHELTAAEASILTNALPHVGLLALGAVDVFPGDVPGAVATRDVGQTSGRSHAPPAPLIPLRL